jgi:hypothetical protein
LPTPSALAHGLIKLSMLFLINYSLKVATLVIFAKIWVKTRL